MSAEDLVGFHAQKAAGEHLRETGADGMENQYQELLALRAKVGRVEAAIRLLIPDDITPQGLRVLRAALDTP